MVRPDDEEPTADELREAEELARLLDGDDVGDRAFDARGTELETASLLRYSTGAGELSSEREDAILRDVLGDAGRAPKPVAAPAAVKTPEKSMDWGRALRWLFGIGGVAAATAIVLLVVRPWRPDATDVATRLPGPSIELLRAQASAATSGGSMAGLSSAMRGYRGGVFDALHTRYADGATASITIEEPARYACEGVGSDDEHGITPSAVIASAEPVRRARPRVRRHVQRQVVIAHAYFESLAK